MPSLLVRALPTYAPWSNLGTDKSRGVYVEDMQCSADQWGPADATFVLRRKSRQTWPDLEFWTPIEIEINNMLMWTGRIVGTPSQNAGGDSISVQAQGWQYALDDRPFSKMFVMNDLAKFVDVRSLPSAFLSGGAGAHPALWQVNAGQDGITMMVPSGSVVGNTDGCSVQLDLGPYSTVASVAVDIETSNNGGTTLTLYGFAGDTDQPQSVPGGGSHVGTVTQNLNVATASLSATCTPGLYRYVSFRIQANAGFTAGADSWVKIKRVLICYDSAYQSSGASILKSTNVVADAFARVPDIYQLIQGVSSFPIPSFEMSQQTPRDAITAANAFQDWVATVNADRALLYRPRTQSPILSLSDQTAFDDLSSGSGDLVYNEVVYQGTGPDGAPVSVTRVPSDSSLPPTIPDRRGRVKSYTISSDASLTAAAASQLCDVFLSQRNRMPFKGQVHATSRRSVSFNPGAGNVPPWQLLQYSGELMLFKHVTDPDTGGLGRDGRIARVTYTYSSDTAEVDIDSTAGSFEAVLARLAAVTAR